MKGEEFRREIFREGGGRELGGNSRIEMSRDE